MHDLDETPLEGSHDVFMHEKSSSLAFDNIALPNPLDHTYVSPTCSQPFIFPEYSLDAPIDNPKICDSNVSLGHEVKMFSMLDGNVDNFLSLGCVCRYDAFLDPHCIYLVDKPTKIMWNIFFAFAFDFSIDFALLKEARTFFTVIVFMLSYCYALKLFAKEFDKLLHALMMSDLEG